MFLEHSLEYIAKNLNAEHVGEEVVFNKFCIDSRTICPGNCYIALSGENFDGHDFAAQAVEKGAVALVVERQLPIAVPQIITTNTRLALGHIARLLRNQITVPVIGITGSCGKTTVKSMIASILSQRVEILATAGTQNNDIGVPLTLFNYEPQHQYVVLEMGTNHFGEIAYLNEIAQPDIVMINNVRPVHLEGFGDLDGVAKAKGEILAGIKPSTIAILPKDDHYFEYWQASLSDNTLLTFSTTQAADIFASELSYNTHHQPQFKLTLKEQSTAVQLAVVGEHNVHNALAAAAACYALGVNLSQIKYGLEAFAAVNGRLNIRAGENSSVIIDDSYNSNPEALISAMKLLSQYENKKKYLVLADMGELGEHAADYHAEIGRLAKEYGVHGLYALGSLTPNTVEAFGEGATHFQSKPALIKAVQPNLNADTCLLVKGSRSAKMEEVVSALTIQSTECSIC